MNIRLAIKLVFLLSLMAISLASCSKEESQNKQNLSVLNVSLKSSTNHYSNVFLDIENVEIRVKDSNYNNGAWMSLKTINAGTHNADDIQAENALTLVEDFEIQATSIYEIRLNLGDNNFMNINNVLHFLDVQNVGNTSTSNILSTTLLKDRFYNFIIHIDIDDSIHFDAQQNMMVLKPKIYTEIRQMHY